MEMLARGVVLQTSGGDCDVIWSLIPLCDLTSSALTRRLYLQCAQNNALFGRSACDI